MNTQHAYNYGFVKRAAEYGVSQRDAIRLLKTAFDADYFKGSLAKDLTQLGLSAAANAGLGAINTTQQKISPEEITNLRNKLKIPDSVKLDLANQGEHFLNIPKMNAYFEPGENVIRTLSSNMNTGPVLAHEFGHANIHHGGGPMAFLQDKVYPHTNRLGALAGLGLSKGMNTETSSLKGALYGAGSQLAAHSGKIIPELEASRRGISALNEGKPLKEQIKNYTSVAPGTASYIAPIAGGAVQGAMKAHANKLRQSTAPANIPPANPVIK